MLCDVYQLNFMLIILIRLKRKLQLINLTFLLVYKTLNLKYVQRKDTDDGSKNVKRK
jgi:hypothetical protein